MLVPVDDSFSETSDSIWVVTQVPEYMKHIKILSITQVCRGFFLKYSNGVWYYNTFRNGYWCWHGLISGLPRCPLEQLEGCMQTEVVCKFCGMLAFLNVKLFHFLAMWMWNYWISEFCESFTSRLVHSDCCRICMHIASLCFFKTQHRSHATFDHNTCKS
jgi:hypothetical protein